MKIEAAGQRARPQGKGSQVLEQQSGACATVLKGSMAILSDGQLTANGDGTWLPRTSPQTLKTRFHGEISLPFLLTQF